MKALYRMTKSVLTELVGSIGSFYTQHHWGFSAVCLRKDNWSVGRGWCSTPTR